MSEFDDASTFRELFDRAMDEAPDAPTLADIELGGRRPGDVVRIRAADRRRWVSGAAAAVIVGVVGLAALWTSRDSAVVRTSDTVVVDTSSAPTTTATEVPVVATVEEDANTTGPSTSSTPPVVVSASADGRTVVRSGDGVAVAPFLGDFVEVIGEDVTSAFGASDGRIFALVPGRADVASPDSIVAWDPATNVVSTIEIPMPTAGAVTLHDVATVNGAIVLLYETGPVVCDVAADECDSVLHVVEPDSGRTERLVTLNGARSEWVTLSLSDTGVVVGEIAGEEGTDFYGGLSGTRIDAEPPTSADLGLAPGLADCTNCPRAYTIDRDGRHLVWRQGPDLVVVDLLEPARRVVVRDVVPDLGSANDDVTLSIDRIVLDGDTVSEGLVAFDSSNGTTSAVVDLSDGSVFGPFTGRSTLF